MDVYQQQAGLITLLALASPFVVLAAGCALYLRRRRVPGPYVPPRTQALRTPLPPVRSPQTGALNPLAREEISRLLARLERAAWLDSLDDEGRWKR